MKNSMNALLLTAALSGLSFGVQAASAQPANQNGNEGANRITAQQQAQAGVRYTSYDQDKEKHACKGKNSCKGQGGCKSSDNGCAGKNSCKGKGGCATDGSKAPKAV